MSSSIDSFLITSKVLIPSATWPIFSLAKEKIGQVAEGIRTLEVIKNESIELDIKMPLVESLYNIIYLDSSPDVLISDLINNPHEVDVEFTY